MRPERIAAVSQTSRSGPGVLGLLRLAEDDTAAIRHPIARASITARFKTTR